MIVVDTNVIAGTYLSGEASEIIEALTFKEKEWFAPYLWRSELRNVLALYCRQSLLNQEQALVIARRAEDRMRNRERWPVSERVLQLADLSGCTAYDCEFVSVALDLQLPLVTFDKKVLKQFPSIAVSPEEFISK
ncbi:MAG: type II toxin-antitoxin system VapC family toxin [Kiritimatiellales bacterium]|nr:type II toxin-antitoxin system VapC family toxin [Kiritimatiellales bacterium]